MEKKLEEPVAGKKRLAPAWHDPDDDLRDEEGVKQRRVKTEPRFGQPYRNRLIENFEMVYGPTPSWAELDDDKMKKPRDSESDEESDEEDETSKSNGYGNMSSRNSSLPQGKLGILKVLDLNAESRTEGAVIRSVDFHPKNPVGLVAGSSGLVSLYQVDGSTNAPIQSVNFGNFPLRNATFCATGEEIYVSSGLIGHFYSYDMRSGNVQRVKPGFANQNETIRKLVPSPDDKYLVALGHNGLINVYSKRSKEVISSLSVNGEVKDVAFTPDGSTLFSYGETGEVCRFDMNSFRCTEKFSAEGAFGGTRIAAGSKYLACGSTTGFVTVVENKYEPIPDDQLFPSNIPRKPIGELKNLQTSISSIKFNPFEEMLAIGSVEKENALRLIHLPSLTVFPRFPFVNANYGRPNCLAFSPNSGYLAIGNNRGSAHLFRLKHYDNY